MVALFLQEMKVGGFGDSFFPLSLAHMGERVRPTELVRSRQEVTAASFRPVISHSNNTFTSATMTAVGDAILYCISCAVSTLDTY